MTQSQPQWLFGMVLVGLFAACSAANHEDEGSQGDLLTGCSYSVTQNTYDGPNYWGTMTVKNTGTTSWTGFNVDFYVPSGAHCTNDAVPSGATLSPLTGSGTTAKTTSNHCIFTWANGPTLNANISKTINYSTDSQSFSSASNVTVSDSTCTLCTPESDSAFCSRLGKNCGTVTAAD